MCRGYETQINVQSVNRFLLRGNAYEAFKRAVAVQGNDDQPCEKGFKKQVQGVCSWIFLDVFKPAAAADGIYNCIFYDFKNGDR